MSPRERTYTAQFTPRAALGADSQASRSFGRSIATIALFAAVALPVGIVLSSMKSRQQIAEEKAAFRQLGYDWEKRFQHPK